VAYIYVKNKQTRKSRKKIKIPAEKKKYIALGFLLVGVLTFWMGVFPIIKFQLVYSSRFNQVISPLSNKFYNQGGQVLGEVSSDYTQLSNWFINNNTDDKTPSLLAEENANTKYFLSIPKLNIFDAVVEIGSMDLKKSLIQYPQTALPGQLGNAVVFGHSVLPQFFNPKAYMTIFSTLFKLNINDEIELKYDNIKYKYVVEDIYEVQATDFSVLEQRFDARYLTLITCSPPGTYLRRLVIKSKIL
jgi:sortase A